MKKILLLALLLCASPLYAQESVVRQAKADLASSGVIVEHQPCSDFEIAKVVAGRVPNAGLLTKPCCGDESDPNRSHCLYQGVWYAHDIVAIKEASGIVLVDIATDGGGSNGTQWAPEAPDPGLSDRYRSATDLGLTGVVVGGGTSPVPPSTPPATDVSELTARIADLTAQVMQLQQRVTSMQNELSDEQARVADAVTQANASAAAVAHIGEYLKAHPLADGCKVSFLGCRLTFNYAPVQ